MREGNERNVEKHFRCVGWVGYVNRDMGERLWSMYIHESG